MAELSNLEQAFAAIDAANAADTRTTTVDGTPLPYELVYGQRMSAVLTSFAPASAPALQIAARAQHLERWAIPRSDYSMDRVGYLTWRNDQKKRHAERAGELLKPLGFALESIKRVQFLLEKKRLKQDAETQTLEDVICLVFLEHYALEFAGTHPEEKVVDILQKTWGKMSAEGQAAALRLALPEAVSRLVKKALGDG
ncbi:MAG: DUF4202 domain-containing protein [Lewinella sp.]|jgi:hypothetical protein|nr:DUF4202 domain-containing protein [Lewinella sp.]